jgi:hypothetical protein
MMTTKHIQPTKAGERSAGASSELFHLPILWPTEHTDYTEKKPHIVCYEGHQNDDHETHESRRMVQKGGRVYLLRCGFVRLEGYAFRVLRLFSGYLNLRFPLQELVSLGLRQSR